MQRQKQKQREQKDVQRVLQTASESENKLGVALKVSEGGEGGVWLVVLIVKQLVSEWCFLRVVVY